MAPSANKLPTAVPELLSHPAERKASTMSLDQQVQPTEPVAPRDSACDRVDAYYSRLFGWSVKWWGLHPFLALENGICAVTMPELDAGPVLAWLDAIETAGPATTLQTQHGHRVAVLAETDGLIPPRATLPKDVEVLAWGTLLPLPIGSRRAESTTEWLSAPDPRQRWLPSLGAVLAGFPTRAH